MSYSGGGSCDRKAFFAEIARGAAGLGLAAATTAVAPSMAAAKEVTTAVGCAPACCGYWYIAVWQLALLMLSWCVRQQNVP